MLQPEGYISNLIDSYDNSVSYLADKITSRETQIDSHATVLRHQYEQMQMQLSQLLSTQNYLNSVGLFDY